MNQLRAILVGCVILLVIGIAAWFFRSGATGSVAVDDGRERIRVVFSGGYETDPVDHGRPVALIAGALGVPAAVFRDAFSRVRPARGGTAPDRQQVRENKAALMAVLGPYGISNERLDQVSDYYRYNRRRGEMWPTEPGTAYALRENGVIVDFEITDSGSGYTTAPTVSVPGVEHVAAKVQLAFGRQFASNGSIVAITASNGNSR